MTTGIERFKMEEKIRMLFFKHRGNILAIAKEGDVDVEYVRKITQKIKRRRLSEADFSIACNISEAILLGREQRLYYLQRRLDDILTHKHLVSVCCSSSVKENMWEEEIHYKCKKCGADCEVDLSDDISDLNVTRLVDLMRKEDEMIGKFLALMGFVAKGGELAPELEPAKPIKRLESKDIITVDSEDREFLDMLRKIDPKKVTSLKKRVLAIVKEEAEAQENNE